PSKGLCPGGFSSGSPRGELRTNALHNRRLSQPSYPLKIIWSPKDQSGLVIPGNEIAIADEVSKTYTLKPGARLVFPPKSMDITRMQGSRRYLVFEGVAAGQGELVAMLLRDGKVVVESTPLHLRLMDVKEMFQRAQAGPVDGYPPPYAYPNTEPPAVEFGIAPWRPSFAFDPDPYEEPNVAVFVHGWNMSEEEAVSFSETMFKRLWHVGFKGRLAAFRWPTHVAETPTYADSYNLSEHRALEYGVSLKMFVDSLPASYQRSILAHSLGGVITTSALRYGMRVRNVLLMQSAISAGVFDESSLLNWSDLVLSEAAAESWLKTPDDFQVERGYRGYFESAEVNIVNYCNEGDFALQTGEIGPVPTNWIANQQLQKPHWPGLSDYRSYLWKSDLSNASIDTRFRYGFRNRPQKILRFVNQINEIQAFIARSRTRAVGAEPRTAGYVNAGKVKNLREHPFNFRSARLDHSAQFHRPCWFAWEFYLSILSDLGF
ncbi:MAG: alpha/beta hydrolase, partial [Verrucomicrobia bacterium]|nr:alpha/beta hydrolase [Verrucomicrobiota bacterium]